MQLIDEAVTNGSDVTISGWLNRAFFLRCFHFYSDDDGVLTVIFTLFDGILTVLMVTVTVLH